MVGQEMPQLRPFSNEEFTALLKISFVSPMLNVRRELVQRIAGSDSTWMIPKF